MMLNFLPFKIFDIPVTPDITLNTKFGIACDEKSQDLCAETLYFSLFLLTNNNATFIILT